MKRYSLAALVFILGLSGLSCSQQGRAPVVPPEINSEMIESLDASIAWRDWSTGTSGNAQGFDIVTTDFADTTERYRFLQNLDERIYDALDTSGSELLGAHHQGEEPYTSLFLFDAGGRAGSIAVTAYLVGKGEHHLRIVSVIEVEAE